MTADRMRMRQITIPILPRLRLMFSSVDVGGDGDLKLSVMLRVII